MFCDYWALFVRIFPGPLDQIYTSALASVSVRHLVRISKGAIHFVSIMIKAAYLLVVDRGFQRTLT
jgi:hypothetical protein